MKKQKTQKESRNFYQRTVNLTILTTLFMLVRITLITTFSLVASSINATGSGIDESFFLFVKGALKTGTVYLLLLTSLPLTTLALLVSINIMDRHKHDSVSNYIKSIYQTIRIRIFLRQDESSEYVNMNDGRQATKRYNPILVTFNRTMSKTVADIRNDNVTVIIKYPKTRQTQKILKDMNEDIKEELASMNPDYIFSSSVREGNLLVFKATHR